MKRGTLILLGLGVVAVGAAGAGGSGPQRTPPPPDWTGAPPPELPPATATKGTKLAQGADQYSEALNGKYPWTRLNRKTIDVPSWAHTIAVKLWLRTHVDAQGVDVCAQWLWRGGKVIGNLPAVVSAGFVPACSDLRIDWIDARARLFGKTLAIEVDFPHNAGRGLYYEIAIEWTIKPAPAGVGGSNSGSAA